MHFTPILQYNSHKSSCLSLLNHLFDEIQHFVGPDLGTTCLKRLTYQLMTKVATSKERVTNAIFLVNPFMPNVFSHPNRLDKSISNFRAVGWYFIIFIQILKETSAFKHW